MDTHLPSAAAPQGTTARTRPAVGGITTWLTVGLLSAIVLGGLALRLATFERFLPYIDYSDEANYYILLQHYMGYEDAAYIPEERFATRGPTWELAALVALGLNDALREHDWLLPSQHVYALRLQAVFVGTLTAAFIMWAAWQVGGVPAAVASGFVWAFAPHIIDINSLAIPDPYGYLFGAAAIATALHGWRRAAPPWLLVSLVCGVMAIYAKTPNVFAVLPFSAAALALFVQAPRRTLPWMAVYAVVALAAMYYLFGVEDVFGTSVNHREYDTFRSVGVQYILDYNRTIENARFAIYVIGLPAFWFGIIGGVAAYFYSRARGGRTLDLRFVAVLLLYFVLAMFLASTFTLARLEAGKLRHVLPGGIPMLILWGALVAQMVWALQAWAQDRDFPAYARAALVSIPLVIPIVGHAPGFIAQNAMLYNNYQKSHIMTDMWDWADASLPREGLVWVSASSTFAQAWNRPWGGYDGDKPFEWWHESYTALAEQSPDELDARNITHVLITDKEIAEKYTPEQAEAIFGDMLLVKTFPAPDIFLWHSAILNGLNEGYMYRVLPPQVTTDVAFGDAIQLVGYDLTDSAQAGDAVSVRLFWEAETTPQEDYSLFVHLYPADSLDMVAQHDTPPLTAQRPTSTWDDPQEVYISDAIRLPLPADVQPGDYRLAVGLYSYASGARLPTTTPEGFHPIPVQVAE